MNPNFLDFEQPIVALEGWAHELLTQWRRRFDALGRHLDALDNEEDA